MIVIGRSRFVVVQPLAIGGLRSVDFVRQANESKDVQAETSNAQFSESTVSASQKIQTNQALTRNRSGLFSCLDGSLGKHWVLHWFGGGDQKYSFNY